MKFKSDIEVQAGLKDSSGSNGSSGQVLSSNGTTVSWVNAGGGVASDVQNLVKAGVAINKGQAVYVTSADGTNIIVGLASNTTEATSSKTLGLLDATVAINGMANVVQIGRLEGLNTLAATVGDPVWLGANGNLIYGLINKPYAPLHLVFIGVVTRVNANNGEIFVNVQNGFELNEIHDVDLKTNVPINGDILGYNGTLWVNKTIAGWLGYTPANQAITIATTAPLSGGGDLSANRTLSISQAGAASNGYLSANDWGIFNGKQNALNGTGFVKISGTTISYDNSTYTPTSRTITINGVTQDLSANQTWTIASGVTSFNTRTGAITLTSGDLTTALGYTPVTDSRTITINGVAQDLSANRSWTVSSTVTSGFSLVNQGAASNTPSSPTANMGVFVDTYAFIDLATAHPDGGWIDFSKANGTDYAGRIRYNNTSDYLSIAAGSNEQVRIFNSNAEALGSFRSPIFYDSNNTGFYLDPSGSSVLNGTVVIKGNDNQLAIDGTTGGLASGLFFRESGVDKYELYHYSGEFRFYNYTTNQQEMSINNASGFVTSRTSFRAPIFYDSNDTSFYTDPASTSNLNKLRITSAGNSAGGNILMGPAGEGVGKWSYLTGTHYNATSQSKGVSIIGLYASASENAISIGGNIYEANPATEIRFYTHNAITHDTGGSVRMVINSAGNVEANVDMRAPIFYDSNNTGYYVDPASTSNLNGLTVANTITGNISGNANSLGSIAADRFVYGDGANGRSKGMSSGNANTSDSSNSSGFYFGTNVTGMPGSDWWNWLTVAGNSWSGSDGYRWQMTGSFWSDDWRLRRMTSGSWSSWVSLLHSGNYNSYSPTLTGGNASGTWGINITGNAATATTSTSSSYSNMDYLMSDRDFPNGTLIQTSINYNNSEGDAFILEIKGNAYGNGMPMDIQIQGYIYANTIINTGGYSNGFQVSSISAIRFGGNLCFWFPSQGYWNGYTVKVYSAFSGRQANKVTSISNSGLPTTDKIVNFTTAQSLRSDNYRGYSNFLTSVYGPNYYDSDDTAYYANFASTSDIAVKQRGGTMHGPNVTWGAYLLVGGDGRQNYTDTTVASVCTTNGNLHLDSGSGYSTHINFYDGNDIIFGNGANTEIGRVYNAGYLQMSGSVRAALFYDSNNTGYYLDPASTSNLYDLIIAGQSHKYLFINPGNGYEAMVRYNGGSGSSWYSGKRTANTTQAGTDGFHFYSDAAGDTVVGFGADGTIRGKGDVVAYSSSDRQLKDNIKPIENALEKVKQISGYTFDWNNKQTIYEGHDVGVIAQEIEAVLPEVVTTRDTGFKAVKYEKIVPLLIEAIKEQQTQIEELKQLIKNK
jgi:hypothetical protein